MFFPFNLKLSAQLTTYAAVILGFSAAAAWLRDDAKNDALAEAKLQYEAANNELKLEVARRVKKLDELTNILKTTEQEAARLQGENTVLLEKQRETVPLSEACNSCRIPNERLWLRGKATADRIKGSVHPKSGVVGTQ